MHTTVSYRGDAAVAPPALTVAGEAGEVRCLVWAVDLSDARRPRGARRALRSGTEKALAATRESRDLKHLVIAYRCAVPHRRRLIFTAQSVARRLHSEIERARGRYIDIVVIDLTGLDQAELLTRRLRELAQNDSGIVGYAAIPWEDLRAESIRETCTRDVI